MLCFLILIKNIYIMSLNLNLIRLNGKLITIKLNYQMWSKVVGHKKFILEFFYILLLISVIFHNKINIENLSDISVNESKKNMNTNSNVDRISKGIKNSLLYSENFELLNALDNWTIHDGNWFIENGHLVIYDTDPIVNNHPRIQLPVSVDGNWEIIFYQYWESGPYFENGLLFDFSSWEPWQGYYLWPSANGVNLNLNKINNVNSAPLIHRESFSWSKGQWYKFTLIRFNEMILSYIDDNMIINVNHTESILGDDFGFFLTSSGSTLERIWIDNISIIARTTPPNISDQTPTQQSSITTDSTTATTTTTYTITTTEESTGSQTSDSSTTEEKTVTEDVTTTTTTTSLLPTLPWLTTVTPSWSTLLVFLSLIVILQWRRSKKI